MRRSKTSFAEGKEANASVKRKKGIYESVSKTETIRLVHFC